MPQGACSVGTVDIIPVLHEVDGKPGFKIGPPSNPSQASGHPGSGRGTSLGLHPLTHKPGTVAVQPHRAAVWVNGATLARHLALRRVQSTGGMRGGPARPPPGSAPWEARRPLLHTLDQTGFWCNRPLEASGSSEQKRDRLPRVSSYRRCWFLPEPNQGVLLSLCSGSPPAGQQVSAGPVGLRPDGSGSRWSLSHPQDILSLRPASQGSRAGPPQELRAGWGAGGPPAVTGLFGVLFRLRPFTSYKLRLKATNDIGDSDFSAETEAVTTLQDGECAGTRQADRHGHFLAAALGLDLWLLERGPTLSQGGVP